MKITISGTAGSGKSSVASLVAKRLGYVHYSMGDMQRSMAKERGVTISELGKLESEDDSLDRMIDEKQREIGKQHKDLVVDSWLAPFFIPDSVKIFLDADIGVRVSRRLGHRRPEEKFEDYSQAKADMLERENVNRNRWMRYYDYDWTDRKNYDLVIDTSKLTIHQVADRITDFLKQKI